MRARRQHRDRRAFIVLTAPAILWFGLFLLGPLVTMFALSLTRWNSLVDPIEWIGLRNFEDMVRNAHFWAAVRNTVVHVAVVVPVVIILGFILGYFLSLRARGHRVFRLVFFAPSMLSVVAVALIFQGFLSPDGAINGTLRAIGLDGLTHSWLVEKGTAMASIIAIDLWAGTGFYAVLFYAALSGVPNELYEAARLDGAGHRVLMRHVAYPSISRFVNLGIMLLFLYVLVGSAANVVLLTQGGPGDLSTTLGYYLYQQAFDVQRYGYSQAIGVVVFFVGFLGLLVASRFTIDRDAPASAAVA